MEGNKLCDVLALEITRVGDPPKEPAPVVEEGGVQVSLKWPYGDDFPWPDRIVPEIPEPLKGVKVPEHWHGGENLDRPNGPLPGDIVFDIGTMTQHVVAMSPERQTFAHDIICRELIKLVKLDVLRSRKRQNRNKKIRGSVIRNRSKQSFRKPR